MTPHEFVRAFVDERNSLVSDYMSSSSDARVARDIAAMGLNAEQLEFMQNILKGVLTDAFYTVLLALDGEASIGGLQRAYALHDEDGTELTGGELEVHAYELFHGQPRSS